jgi:hypothetical protein
MKISVARSAQVYCAGLALYLFVIRPALLRWGASGDEVRRDYPVDRAVPDPHTVSTRALTIRAQPDQIWPWLAQIGRRPRRPLQLRLAGPPVRLHRLAERQ